MNKAAPPTLMIRDMIRALLKWKLFVIGSILLSLSVGAVVCVVLPKSYRSRTLILVEDQKVPQQYVKGTFGGSIEERLTMIQQQVMSRSLLSLVIDEFGLYQDEIKRNGMDITVENMRKGIKVDTVGTVGRQGKTVEAFTLSFAHEDPSVAMKVTAKLAAQFIEENLKAREQLVTGAAEFLEQELRLAKARLEVKEQAISEFKSAHVGELPQQMEANLRTLDRLAADRNSSAEVVALLTERLRTVENNIAEYNSSGVVSVDGSNSQRPADPVFLRLKELERNETALSSEYKGSYPDLVIVRREIEKLRRELEGKAPDNKAGTNPAVGKSKVFDPYLQGLIKHRNEVRGELTAATDRYQWVVKQIKELEGRVEHAPVREQELLMLLRDYDNMQKNYQTLLEKQLDARVAQNLEMRQKGEQFRIIDPANLPDTPDSPDMVRIMLLSLAAGCGVGVGVVMLAEQAKPVFRRAEEVESMFGLQVLGVIPDFSLAYGIHRGNRQLAQLAGGGADPLTSGAVSADRKPSKKNESVLRRIRGRLTGNQFQDLEPPELPDRLNWVTRLCPASMVAEQFRVVATRLTLLGLERKSTVVVVTSAVKGEGKTTTAMNVAYALARDLGKFTLLIDADLKAPKVHAYTGISNENGLLDLLKRREEHVDVVDRFAHRIDETSLWVIPAGGGETPSSELMDVQRIARLLVDLRSRFEYIVIDAPPVLPLADMNIFVQMADVLLLVIRVERTSQHIVGKSLAMLKPECQVGVILNGLSVNSLPSYYYPYGKVKQSMKMIGV